MDLKNSLVLCLVLCTPFVKMQESKALDDAQNCQGSSTIGYEIEKLIRDAVRTEMAKIRKEMNEDAENIRSAISASSNPSLAVVLDTVLKMSNDTTKMQKMEEDVERLKSGLEESWNEIHHLESEVNDMRSGVDSALVMREQTKRIVERDIPRLKRYYDAARRQVSYVKSDLRSIRSRLTKVEGKTDEAVTDLKGFQAIQKKYRYAGWKTVNIEDKYWYYISDSTYTWPDAKSFCEGHGGHLAAVGLRNISDFGSMFKFLKDSAEVWIGLSDPQSNGQWQWIDSVAATWADTDWSQGADPEHQLTGDQYCGEFSYEAVQGILNEVCSEQRQALCEIVL